MSDRLAVVPTHDMSSMNLCSGTGYLKEQMFPEAQFGGPIPLQESKFRGGNNLPGGA